MIPMSWWRAGLVGLLICVGLPVWGHWSRQDARPRCAWDGLVIDSRFRVVVDFAHGSYPTGMAILPGGDLFSQTC